MNQKIEKYRHFFDRIKGDQYFGRLGKTFVTNEKYYFLDTGTGKIAELNPNVYKVLKCMLENDGFSCIESLGMDVNAMANALEEIIEAVKKEHILSAPEMKTMTGEPVVNLERTYDGCISNLTLEVTEKCNLRCKYCIYQQDNSSFRDFGNENMAFETAKKSIDFFEEHSRERKEVYIGFYGGEPLLNFDVIKKSVDYANSLIKDRKIIYSMTTNATLINRDIARFLVEKDFDILVSLDGPEDVHNENRVFNGGTGSFEATIRGIKLLLNLYEEMHKEPSIGFSMVTSGPEYEKKYEKIQRFFSDADWIPENYVLMPSTVSHEPMESNYVLPQSKEEREIHKELTIPLLKWSDDQKQKESLFSAPYMNKNLAIIHKRLLLDYPVKDYGMNGCCVPGGRRVYISVKGNIYPCEKVGDVPTLGDVYSGLDINKIRKIYVKDFIEEAVKYCKNCWAVNLCTLCYVNCYDKDGLHYGYRHNACVSERKFLEDTLSVYHSLLESNPQIIEALNQVEFE